MGGCGLLPSLPGRSAFLRRCGRDGAWGRVPREPVGRLGRREEDVDTGAGNAVLTPLLRELADTEAAPAGELSRPGAVPEVGLPAPLSLGPRLG
ncbi:hypothetical protein NDU88_006369 [Pleurodeles waltl]|uniref:Uncharacterized protein n=1 Tax=Pleurodeles waltl TaxID=8319 RepID=A0AAV7UKS3_PLEWA|nr:hypothetical protein NDU88_006369 [Pleurodeles waltl]